MTGPPRKRKGDRRGTAPDPSKRTSHSSNRTDLTSQIELSQLRPREIGPGELAALRAIWWRQASAGHRLPAEIGVIVVDGGLG